MTPRTAHRSRRVSLLALAVTIASLVLAGWAVRGVLQEPVPTVTGFGSAAATGDVDPSTTAAAAADPSAATVGSTVATSPPTRPAPTASAGSLPTPGRSSAALPEIEPRPTPVRLAVPAVGLEVTVEDVGVRADGQMEIPDEGDRAGWYRHGPRPGAAEGSVVVAAHVDTDTGPGAFLALTEVAEGDEVQVELSDGTSVTYRIVGGEQVAKTDLPVDDLFRRDGDPVLRLVTCTGDWSPRAGSYTDNLVISAVPVS
ncbi:class F sortase [Ornithinimicrobium flavum]|uniref:class F sortase n=1 Tax=Ornithinimicrobium flavum TaxID=1288636 RepID=UPI00106F62F8|nr:class F sortase [Ornithinimicrobium flavum]